MIPVGILTAAATSSFNYLLDLYPSAAAAYSVRKLRSAYTGFCLQITRPSDFATLDIGFVNNVVDTTAITTFVGAQNGYVIKWYDQSGNGNNASVFSAVSTNNPKIVLSGTLITQNGKPSLNFVINPFQFLSTISTSADISVFLTGKADSLSTAGPLLGPVGSGPFIGQFIGQYLIQTGNSNVLNQNFTAANSANTNFKINSLYGIGTYSIYVNNTLVPITTTSTFTATNNLIDYIGNYGGAYYTVGYISEVVIYKLNQISNNTGINTNINSFYTIY